MSPSTRSHGFAAPPPDATRECPLPADLLLEIVARSDAATLLRCAASCKPLRRDILSPAFIRRVCREPDGIVPPSLLGFLDLNPEERNGTRPPPAASFSLAHPATPAAASFSEKHLAPLLSRSVAAAASLVGFGRRASRNGLILLSSECTSEQIRRMCVFDPMTSNCKFFPGPPDNTCGGLSCKCGGAGVYYTYVLLTAADGIAGFSFLLLAADTYGFTDGSIKVRTMPSNCTWSPVTIASYSGQRRRDSAPLVVPSRFGAVVVGSLIHWLMCSRNGQEYSHIVTYDVCTATAGSIELPMEALRPERPRRLHMASSPNGGLRLLAVEKLKISVWLLSGSAGWMRHAVIDTEATVRSAVRSANTNMLDMVGSGVKSGVVLLWPYNSMCFELDTEAIIVLDVETKEMRRVNRRIPRGILHFPYEVDMEARLSAMKIF